MMHSDSGFHGIFGFGHWAVGLLFWVVLIVLIVWVIKMIFRDK
ncbi:MAG: hypothetical protein R6X06_11010 [Gammaproteobacteria bacterium]